MGEAFASMANSITNMMDGGSEPPTKKPKPDQSEDKRSNWASFL